MLPEASELQMQEHQEPPGTPPPRSPVRAGSSHSIRRMSTGKEEDAVESLMQLATPVKSPRSGDNGSVTTPGTGARLAASSGAYGAVMTPISAFRKSRTTGEIPQHLQSPFQSPFQTFNFSPGFLFSPPAAGGTLDIPTGDTPVPAHSVRDSLWRQQATPSTPDRFPREMRAGSIGRSCDDGTSSPIAAGNRGGAGGRVDNDGVTDTPGSCGKRKGKVLFTDRRGPQDHSRLGQTWCLGTPGRSMSRGDSASAVHHDLSVANDIPATPDRMPGVDGASVLPPTPQLLPPTPPSRGSREGIRAAMEADAAAGRGDGAADILMGLRSPGGSSLFGTGAGGIAHSLFNGLDEGFDECSRKQSNGDGGAGGSHRRVDHSRGWSDEWSDAGGEVEHGGAGCGDRPPPRAAPSKRYRRWTRPAVSLRNSHCKGSFKIEGMTLIRTASVPSAGGGERSGGNSTVGGGGDDARRRCSPAVKKRNAVGPDRGNCRVSNRGQSIADEPLSPPNGVLSPEEAGISMSRRAASLSPAAKPSTSRGRGEEAGSNAEVPNSAPRPSARSQRADRPRRAGTASSSAAKETISSVTPSPVPRGVSSRGAPSKSTPSKSTPSKATSGSSTDGSWSHQNNGASCATPPQSPERGAVVANSPPKAKPAESSSSLSSYHSPEPTSTRRGKACLPDGGAGVAGGSNEPPAAAASAVTPDDGGGTVPVTIAVAVGGGVGIGGAGGKGGGGEVVTCNCKKSKCLKLYCECFQRKLYCKDCNCKDCLNTSKTEAIRQSAIQSTIERNPSAFVSKFERRVGGKRAHNAGCNCKKSACLKKYCECFQAGVACGSNCKCSNCKNFEGAGGGRKRRAPDPSAASVLVQAPRTQLVQAPRTPPRSVSRGRRPGAVVATGPSHDEIKTATAAGSPDSFDVQVGGDDDDNGYSNGVVDVRKNLLADALSEGATAVATLPATAALPAAATAAVATAAASSTTATGGSGGGEPSDTPQSTIQPSATNAVAVKRGGISPAASAVADCAVSKSLLDMGGTPTQAKRMGSREDSGFELSVVASSPRDATGGGGGPWGGGEDCAGRSGDDGNAGNLVVAFTGGAELDFAGVSSGGLRDVTSGRGQDEKSHELMAGATCRDLRDNRERRKSRDSIDIASCFASDEQEERAGDGNGGLVASGESKAGGQCLTPPAPVNTVNGGSWDGGKIAAPAGAGGGAGGTCGGEESSKAAATGETGGSGTFCVI